MSSSNMFARLTSSAMLALILALVGCGGDGTVASGTDCSHPISINVDGCAYVRLSDGTGDFLAYRV